MKKLNAESLTRLYKTGNMDIMDSVEKALEAFSSYHSAIYKLENVMRLSLYSNDNDIKHTIESLAQRRTAAHNAVITYIKIINRICEQQSLPLVFEGIVSEDRPYRTELADAVLDFVETVVKNREKGI